MLTNTPFLLPGDPNHVCLLLHGLGGGVYEMQWLGEYLHQRGLSVQAILYPGHRQDQPGGGMPRSRWQDWFTHIQNTYLTLAQTYPRISIVGFSTGCPLGLHLAAQHPVFKLVMLAPYFRLRSQWYYGLTLEAYIHLLGWLITDVPRMGLPIFDPVTEAQARAAAFFRTFNITSVKSAMELIEQVKPQLSTVHSPTLIVQSPHDSVVDPQGAVFLYNQLAASEKTLHWLQRSNHIITLDYERDEVMQRVGNFLVR
ncbi:MAG TPA: alpha/beta fold hydrolase [Stenomitos sp.]